MRTVRRQETAENTRGGGGAGGAAASSHLHIIGLRPLMRAVSCRCDATPSFHIGPPLVGLGAIIRAAAERTEGLGMGRKKERKNYLTMEKLRHRCSEKRGRRFFLGGGGLSLAFHHPFNVARPGRAARTPRLSRRGI